MTDSSGQTLSLFEKIVQGKIPSTKIYETDTVYAFLDINPIHPGHTLVIPKKCYPTLLEIPDELISDVHKATKVVAKAVKEATGCAGFNILQNNGKESGQIIFHYHVHVIPRYSDDGISFAKFPHVSYKDDQHKEATGKKIRDAIAKLTESSTTNSSS